MTAHMNDRQIDRYLQKGVSADEQAQIEAHLHDCPACRDAAAKAQAVYGTFQALMESGEEEIETDHPPYEQLQLFADGRQSELSDIEREIAEAHLEVCSQCNEEILALRTLAEELPAVSTESQSAGAPAEKKPFAASVRDWFSALRAAPVLPVALVSGLSSAAVVALVAFLVWPQQRPPSPSPQLAALSKQVASLVQHQQEMAAQTASANKQLAQSVASNQQLEHLNTHLSAQVEQLSKKVAAQPSPSRPTAAPLQPAEVAVYVATPDTLERVPTAIGKALVSKTVQKAPELASVETGYAPQRAFSSEFHLVRPVGTVVKDTHPTLEWTPVPDAMAYTVEIKVAASKRTVLTSSSLPKSKTSWTVGDGLKPGGFYSWRVKAITSAGTVTLAPPAGEPEARFRILTAARARQIEEMEQRYAPAPMVLGIIYAQAGLLDAAEQTLEPIARQTTGNTAASQLLQSIRALR